MKNIKATIAIICALFVITASIAQAQDKKTKVRKPGVTVYDFNEANLTGKIKSPDIGTQVVREGTEFKRLFDLDESFLPNIVRSVDDF